MYINVVTKMPCNETDQKPFISRRNVVFELASSFTKFTSAIEIISHLVF